MDLTVQILFSGKNKNISKCRLLKILLRVLSINLPDLENEQISLKTKQSKRRGRRFSIVWDIVGERQFSHSSFTVTRVSASGASWV